MSRQIEKQAEAIRTQIRVGNSLQNAVSDIKGRGFSCATDMERSKERGAPSLFCRKQVTEKVWLGLMKEFHSLLVRLDADNGDKVVSVEVSIGWGGIRGL